ncbi:hypothetical protein NM208_g427 [Fusarium decemcellulare]|uniref:Uncharacterized protein n=1 Tax=Fusarium decemcellulare TaxID=57161 RepID=A0ACC1SZQ3_9HYPO|nr:hypothetical protein NM208_g427 [Fusarium decemcellulare]
MKTPRQHLAQKEDSRDSRDFPKIPWHALNAHTYVQPQAFLSHYFTNKPWSPLSEYLVKEAMECDYTGVCLASLASHPPRQVLRHYLPAQSNIPHLQGTTPYIFLTRTNSTLYQRDYDWSDVQVIGLAMNSESTHLLGKIYLELYKYSQEVFRNNPTRLFIHGYFTFKGWMYLWLFDRCGVYGPVPLNKVDDKEQVRSVLSGYLCMSDAELGLNPLVKKDTLGTYIMSKYDESQEPAKLYLVDPPITYPEHLTDHRSICYRASKTSDMDDKRLFVKFSWIPQKQSSESQFLRLLTDLKISEAVELVSHQDGEPISSIRQALSLGLPTKAEIASDADAVMTCVVLSPLSRLLQNYTDGWSFLEDFRDAIKEHHSSCFSGTVLYCDEPLSNNIAVAVQKLKEQREILIGLDQAAQVDAGSGLADGTKAFMAIDALKSGPHNYRHDLESFFYIFLWLCTCGPGTMPTNSVFYRWATGDDIDIAAKKLDDIKHHFADIVSEFREDCILFKDIAYRLRTVLFFSGVGIPEIDWNQAQYEGVMQAFEVTIQEAKSVVCRIIDKVA